MAPILVTRAPSPSCRLALLPAVLGIALGLSSPAFGAVKAMTGGVPAPSGCLAGGAGTVPPPNGVPQARRDRLARGVNLTDLFVPGSEPDLPGLFAHLRGAGVTHVRVPVSTLVFDPSPPAWQASLLTRLDATVCAAVAAGLGVIIDLHPFEPLRPAGGTPTEIGDRLALVWRQLAARYAAAPADNVFFETLNEPKFDAVQWAAMQATLLAAIRSVAPASTVIATASPWSTAAALSALKPLPDPDVVYNFHLYTPLIFAQQTAAWSTPSYASIRGLDFPATAANAALVARTADPSLQGTLAWYGTSFRDASVMTTEIDLAAGWGRLNQRSVIADEFGVVAAAPSPGRAAWMGAVRARMEADGMGWTVWEYRGGFGIDGDLQGGCAASGSLARALMLCGPGGG